MQTLIDWNEKLIGAPSGVLVFLLCIAVGYSWKAIRVLPNRFIPVLVMFAGAVAFPLLNWQHGDGHQSFVRHSALGFIIGFVAWLAHNQVIKRIEEKLGLFENGDAPPTPGPTEEKKP